MGSPNDILSIHKVRGFGKGRAEIESRCDDVGPLVGEKLRLGLPLFRTFRVDKGFRACLCESLEDKTAALESLKSLVLLVDTAEPRSGEPRGIPRPKNPH